MSKGIAEVNNINIWWEDFGDTSNPSVMLIMGANANSMVWTHEFIQPFVDAGYHVVRFDNRDVGKSTYFGNESFYRKLVRIFVPTFLVKFVVKSIFSAIIDEEGYIQENEISNPNYTLEDMATDTVHLMNHLNIDKAHIIGASMGGMISQLLALDYPERVISITPIMSSPGIGDSALSNMSPNMIKGIEESAILDAKGKYKDSVVRTYRELSGSRFPFNEERFRKKMETVFEHGHNPFCQHGDATGSSPNRKDRLDDIDLPTLIVHGSEDPIFGLDHGMFLYEGIPNAEKFIMDGVGHEIPEELVYDITQRILEHLKKTDAIA